MVVDKQLSDHQGSVLFDQADQQIGEDSEVPQSDQLQTDLIPGLPGAAELLTEK